MTCSHRLELGVSDKDTSNSRFGSFYLILILISSVLFFSGCVEIGNPLVRDEILRNFSLFSDGLNKSCQERDLEYVILPSSSEKYFSFKCENDFKYEIYKVTLSIGNIRLIEEVQK